MSKRNTWILDWRPEDETFWNTTGKAVARRNLIWSIFAEHLGFSIWLVWSIVATKLPQAGFKYTTDRFNIGIRQFSLRPREARELPAVPTCFQ
jgi:NNP family nitrate/nitrite transporter-like MFS transporter